MRIANMLAWGGMLVACDGAVEASVEATPSENTWQFERIDLVAPVDSLDWRSALAHDPGAGVTFNAPTVLGDAECFAVAQRPEGVVIVVARGESGRVDLVSADGRHLETVADASGERRRVTACAVSYDAKSQPHVVIAYTGERPLTVHYRREANTFVATQIADFAATQIAFNARSPRGPEAVIVDATTTSLHLVYDGAWQRRALPATALATPGAKAVAVAVDDAGRSHFALGADYYGDHGDTYAFWPSHRRSDGAVAIVLDGTTPHIVHAEGGALYRSVIGPDSAATTLWSRGVDITGYTKDLAPLGGQLAARLDADGYLHVLAAALETRTHATTWRLEYTQDRDIGTAAEGDTSATTIADTRPTGVVAWVGEGSAIAADHGKLVSVERSSSFEARDPAPVLEAPAVGNVHACSAGVIAGESTVLRHMTELSAVSLAPSGAHIHALEWDFGRRAVRTTVGDAMGWTTDEVTPWALDTMSAGRADMAIDAAGNDHLVWPEGDGVAHWMRSTAGWMRAELELEVVGTPDLGLVGNDLWLAAMTRDGIALSRFDGAWQAPVVIPADATSFDLVDGTLMPTVVFVEHGQVVTATLTPDSVERHDLDIAASHVRGVQVGKQLFLMTVAPGTDTDVVAYLDGAELGRWTSTTPTRVMTALATDAGAMIVWDDANVLRGVTLDATLTQRTLRVSEGATLWTGSATPSGRLIAVEQNQAAPNTRGVDLIGEACAR